MQDEAVLVGWSAGLLALAFVLLAGTGAAFGDICLRVYLRIAYNHFTAGTGVAAGREGAAGGEVCPLERALSHRGVYFRRVVNRDAVVDGVIVGNL